MESGIYEIVNTVSGKRYVGSAVNLKRRWGNHRAALRRGGHRNAHLQSAWNKYGEDAFEFRVIELVPVESLLDVEQKNIDLYDSYSLYNIALVAGSSLGTKRSEESRAKMRKPRVYPKGRVVSDETKRKLSEANKKRWESQKGRVLSDEHRAKLSASLKASHASRKAQELVSG